MFSHLPYITSRTYSYFFFNITMISALEIPTKRKDTAVNPFVLSVHQKLLAQYEYMVLV